LKVRSTFAFQQLTTFSRQATEIPFKTRLTFSPVVSCEAVGDKLKNLDLEAIPGRVLKNHNWRLSINVQSQHSNMSPCQEPYKSKINNTKVFFSLGELFLLWVKGIYSLGERHLHLWVKGIYFSGWKAFTRIVSRVILYKPGKFLFTHVLTNWQHKA